jgi:opacity protein-like surface antigen
MSRTSAVLIVLAVGWLGASPALANGDRDRGVPAPIPVPAPVPIAESFSYYLRADIGWGLAGDPSYSESGAVYGTPPGVPLTGRSIGTGDVFHGSVGAGVYLTPHLRGDITLDLRGTQDINATSTYIDGANTGTVRDMIKLQGTVGLVNLYWDLLPRGSFSPYVGAGIGFVHSNIDRNFVTTEAPANAIVASGSSGADNFGLAAALMAGATFAWNHTWALDVNYRALYMDGGDVTTILAPGTAGISTADLGSQWEHQFRIGLRANIW